MKRVRARAVDRESAAVPEPFGPTASRQMVRYVRCTACRKNRASMNSWREPVFGKTPAKWLCAEGQNRTGDTWFFRSCSWHCANSRLNASTTTHGYDQRQMVQQRRTASRLSVLRVRRAGHRRAHLLRAGRPAERDIGARSGPRARRRRALSPCVLARVLRDPAPRA